MDRSVRRHHSSPGSSASVSPRQGPLSLRGAECLPTVLPWTPLPWNTSDSETSVLCPGPPWCCRRAPAAVESTLRWCGHQRGAWCPQSRCRPCCPARVHRMPRLRSRTSPDGRQRVTRLLLPVSQLRRIPQYSVHSRRVRSKLPEERGVGPHGIVAVPLQSGGGLGSALSCSPVLVAGAFRYGRVPGCFGNLPGLPLVCSALPAWREELFDGLCADPLDRSSEAWGGSPGFHAAEG